MSINRNENGSITKVAVFGSLRIQFAHGAEWMPTQQQQLVLGLLVAARRAPVSAAVFIDEIWGERPPKTARQSLSNQVGRIRRSIGARSTGEPSVIETVGDGYRLGPIAVDGFEIEDGIGTRAVERLVAENGPVWNAVPLDGLYTPRIDLAREQFALAARQLLIDFSQGRLDEPTTAQFLDDGLARDPYDERLWVLRVATAIHREGRRSGELQLDRAESQLAQLAPGSSHRILRAADRYLSSAQIPFGLADHAAILADLLDKGGAVEIVGSAGVGKSTLLAWFGRHARLEDRAVAHTICAAQPASPLDPLWTLCSQLGLDVGPRTWIDPNDADVELELPSLRRELARPGTVLLVDDLHRATDLDRRLIGELQALAASRRFAIVTSFRLPDGGAHQGNQATRVRLEPWDRSQVTEFLAAERADVDADEVMASTGGNPFLVSHLVGRADNTGAGRSMLSGHYRQLTDASRDVIDLAVATSQPVAVAAACKVLERQASEVTEAISAAVAADLLVRDGVSYRVRHDLVLDAVREQLPPERIADLLSAMAEAIEELAGPALDRADVTTIAHYRLLAAQAAPNSHREVAAVMSKLGAARHHRRRGERDSAVEASALAARLAKDWMVPLPTRLEATLEYMHCAVWVGLVKIWREQQAEAVALASSASDSRYAVVAARAIRRRASQANSGFRSYEGNVPGVVQMCFEALADKELQAADRSALLTCLAQDADRRNRWDEIARYAEPAKNLAADAAADGEEAYATLLLGRALTPTPERAVERAELAGQARLLAERSGDADLIAEARWHEAVAHCCLGDFALIDAAADRASPADPEAQETAVRFVRAWRAAVRADIDQALASTEGLGPRAGFIYAQLLVTGAIAPPDEPLGVPGMALAHRCAEVARLALVAPRAEAVAALWSILEGVQRERDHSWALSIGLLAQATWCLRDHAAANALLDLARPLASASCCPTTGPFPYFGSMEQHLATIYLTRGDRRAAHEALALSEAVHARIGASAAQIRGRVIAADINGDGLQRVGAEAAKLGFPGLEAIAIALDT